MKKIIALLVCLLVGLSALFLVSCAKDNNDGEKDSSAAYVNDEAEGENQGAEGTEDKADNNTDTDNTTDSDNATNTDATNVAGSENASTGNSSKKNNSSKSNNTSSTIQEGNDVAIDVGDLDDEDSTSSNATSKNTSSSKNSSNKKDSSAKTSSTSSSKTSSTVSEMESEDGWTHDYIVK